MARRLMSWSFVFVAASGCTRTPTSAPPVVVAADAHSINLPTTRVIQLQWPNGPTVLVLHHVIGEFRGTSAPDTGGQAYAYRHEERIVKRVPVRPPDAPGAKVPPRPPEPPGGPGMKTVVEEGRIMEWRCVTPDGRTGTMTIDGAHYDLSKGNVFLITTEPGFPKGFLKITQIARDLGPFQSDFSNIHELTKTDPEIKAFIEAVPK